MTSAASVVDAGEQLKAALARSQRRNQGILLKLLDGIDDDMSQVRLFPDGGNVNWLLGHLATSRDDALELLGAERLMDAGAEERYGYGSRPTSDSDPAPLASLLQALELANRRVLEELDKLDGARLAAVDERGRSLLERLEFMLWHESYHLGQVTLYRKGAGLASPIG